MEPPATVSRARSSRPPVRLTRALGILTIIYALFLLLYGALSALLVVGFPSMGRLMEEVQSQQEEALSSRRLSAIAELSKRELEATSPADKANLKVDRILLEERREPAMPAIGIGFGMFNSKSVQGFLWTQTITMASMNALLLISGIGLTRTREWGRKIALAISMAKIPALIAFALYGTIQVTPGMAEGFTADVQGMINGLWGGGVDAGLNEREWASYRSAIVQAFSLLLGIYAAFGLVFPIVMLVVLRGRRVRAELARPAKP